MSEWSDNARGGGSDGEARRDGLGAPKARMRLLASRGAGHN